MVTFFKSDKEKKFRINGLSFTFTFFLLILFYSTFKFSNNLYIIILFIFPLFIYLKKIKHIIFYLDLIKKIVLIKWSNARETIILTFNTLMEKKIIIFLNIDHF